MKLRDRMSGAEVELPPNPCLFGRWIFSESGLRLNDSRVESGDALVPGTPGHWTLVRPNDISPLRGHFFADGGLEQQDAAALLELGRILDSETAGGWLEWSDRSPLAPGLEEALQPHPLEQHIGRESMHLRTVCSDPRTHVRLETERVLVSRARKLAGSAPAWLSAHTEDWSHRTIVGVQPRRILADVREEEWEIYENCLTVRLIDQLVTWLRQRIAEIRRVREGIFAPLDALGSSAKMSSASRHRTERLFRMWGGAWADHQRVAQRVARALDRLEQLLYPLLGLMDSPLYRRVSRRARVPRALRITNLFRNDPHYRGVARLWDHWSRLAQPRAPSSSELSEQNQKIHRAFIAWSTLLVVRACEQLRLKPTNDAGLDQPLRPGARVELVDELGFTWEHDGAIALRRRGQDLVRFVPLAHAIDGARTREALSACISPLVESVAAAKHWTIILHPAVLDGRGWGEVASVGSPPFPGIPGMIDFIRVSPFALDSVERVARAIRWAVWAPELLAYPPLVKVSEGLLDVPSSLLQPRGSKSHALLRLPGRDESPRIDLGDRLRWAVDEHDKLSTQRQDIIDQLERVHGDGRRTAELDRAKRKLAQPLEQARGNVNQLEATSRALQEARSRLTSLGRCPVCGESGNFEAHERDCFEARCGSSSCEAVWGLRLDRRTGARIPFLLPGGAARDRWPKTVSPEWVDEQFGSDVLAIPHVGRGDNVSYEVPRTGRR